VDGRLDDSTPLAVFDESSLTGESLPVERRGGDTLLSGAINGLSSITMTATHDAAHSQYQTIVQLVSEASAHPAPVVRLADRYALPFTVLALAIGVVAWVLSGDPVRFAEVVVLATPCPLILAAPIAFISGMSRSARRGIIVKGGAALETIARARSVAFDKTGTLTSGSPTVDRIVYEPGFDEHTLLRLAASAEQYSSHVLASSVIARAGEAGIELLTTSQASEVATSGVAAMLDGRAVRVGKLSFIAEVTVSARPYPLEEGELAIYVSVDDRFAGTIVARDPVRLNARATVEAMVRQGIHTVVLLTGDSPAVAQSVATRVGIRDVRADCLPADKVDTIRMLPERPVIMVGDGVNDAPVLAAADVGIALGARGTTAASDSADIVILIDDLSRAAEAQMIGKDTVRIAKQSIWIGIALSGVLMLIAAGGAIPAAVGAGLQEVVDLVCILNALRALSPGSRIVAATPLISIPELQSPARRDS
jgi:heavy metal translocating P-type ATPase